ncbi:MAG TPA: universal stress protein [Actinomycetes bacterium]|nr:universal stress protein [Actinomycetes bacterium]
MITRILLAVDDSPAALAAARLALDLAARLPARIRALSVVASHSLNDALALQSGYSDLPARREAAGTSVLDYIAELTRQAGLELETRQLSGEPARHILTEAREWPADLIVIGKSGGRQLGEPYVGSQTSHVLEFADRPVLVVPPPGRELRSGDTP